MTNKLREIEEAIINVMETSTELHDRRNELPREAYFTIAEDLQTQYDNLSSEWYKEHHAQCVNANS